MIGKEEGDLIVVNGDGSGEVRADKEGKKRHPPFPPWPV